LASEYKITEFLTFGGSLRLVAGSFNLATRDDALELAARQGIFHIIKVVQYIKI
jgi:hypothetical protein